MPENTGQAESKPEPKPEESKPEPKPEDKPARGKSRYVNYQDLSKDELVAMLKRVNRRLSEANKLINEALGVLYYGNTQAPQEGGGQGNQYRKNYGYRSYGNRQYGRYGNRYKRHSENEDEDVNYD